MKSAPGFSAWRKPRRWVALSIILAAAATFVALRFASNSGVKREIEAIQKRGQPSSPLELDKWYQRVPPDENAALVYAEAYGGYIAPAPGENPGENSLGGMTPGEPLPPELADAITVLISKNQGALETLHRGAGLKASRYSIDLSRGFWTLLPHLSQVKQMANLLKWEAVHHSIEGERSKAVESLKSGFALAASLEVEPVLISSLVRIASVLLMLQATERVVSDLPLTDEELSSLSEILSRAEQNGKMSMSRGMAGERAMAIPAFRMSYQHFLAISGPPPAQGAKETLPELVAATAFHLRQALGFSDRDLSFYLARMEEIEVALEKDYPEMLCEAEKTAEIVEAEVPTRRVRYLVSGMLLPAQKKAVTKEVLLVGQLRCGRMALAIERYRLRNGGKLPSPDELVPAFLPEFPRDPIDNQPLQFEPKEKGYRIVSGAATVEKKKGATGTNLTDVSFSVLPSRSRALDDNLGNR